MKQTNLYFLGVQPSRTSCTEYYNCDVAGVPHRMACHSELHFNVFTSVCDWPASARCDEAAKRRVATKMYKEYMSREQEGNKVKRKGKSGQFFPYLMPQPMPQPQQQGYFMPPVAPAYYYYPIPITAPHHTNFVYPNSQVRRKKTYSGFFMTLKLKITSRKAQHSGIGIMFMVSPCSNSFCIEILSIFLLILQLT